MRCARWSALAGDLAGLHDELVAVAAVVDPFGDYSLSDLESSFDGVVPYKDHFVVDLLTAPPERLGSRHRRQVRRAAKTVSVERCSDPRALLEEWTKLYERLIERHQIRGLAAFSALAFQRQFDIPGLVAYRADTREGLCGMILWFVNEEVGYYHLGAYSEVGYQNRASYALFAVALEQLASDGLRWASLGGGAGRHPDIGDGLSRFKAGWSTGRRTAYFCSRVLDTVAYQKLVQSAGGAATTYFPAYRHGEFR